MEKRQQQAIDESFGKLDPAAAGATMDEEGI